MVSKGAGQKRGAVKADVGVAVEVVAPSQPLADISIAGPAVATDNAGAEVKRLRAQLCSVQSTATIAAVIAGIAVIVGLMAPVWAPELIANDPQSKRTLMLAAAHLHHATTGSDAFASELALVRLAVDRDADAVSLADSLSPFAQSGAPTLDQLNDQFADMAGQVAASKVVGSNENIVSRGMARMASLVKLDALVSDLVADLGPMGASVDLTVVHDASALLRDGDLRQAVAKVGELDGDSAKVASAWVDGAKRRLAVDDAVDKLDKLALARAGEPASFGFR